MRLRSEAQVWRVGQTRVAGVLADTEVKVVKKRKCGKYDVEWNEER